MADKFRQKFEEMMAQQKQINAGAKELEKSLGKQLEMQNDILKVKGDILNTEKRINQFVEDEAAAQLEISELQKKIEAGKKDESKLDKKAVDDLKKQLRGVQKIKLEKGEKLKLAKEELVTQEKGLQNMKDMVSQSNKLKSLARSTGNFVKKWGFDKLKEYGVFEMDKEIRNAARSMGVGNKQYKAFSNNLQKAGDSTVLMGVSTKELAKMQRGYSEEIGRSVALSKEGMVAMAEMSEGTGLGEQFAVGMAGAMDKFGGSVETSRDLVQETVDIAGAMGVNSAKAA